MLHKSAHEIWGRAKRSPERSTFTALVAMQRGIAFGRPLTLAERLCLGVVAAKPTHHLTLDSADLSMPSAGRAWSLLLRRLHRSRNSRKRLVYLAVAARSTSGAGAHLHVLCWEYIHAPMLGGHARKVGFGWPHIQRIPTSDEDLLGAMDSVAYVLGQHQPVFGTHHEQRHLPRGKGQWRFRYPQRRILQQYNPNLLSALDRAQSQKLSDKQLVEALPMFSSNKRQGWGSRYEVNLP